jgi:hypothetical protein
MYTMSSSLPDDALTRALHKRRAQRIVAPLNLKHLLLNHSASISTSNKGQVVTWSKKPLNEIRLNTGN